MRINKKKLTFIIIPTIILALVVCLFIAHKKDNNLSKNVESFTNFNDAPLVISTNCKEILNKVKPLGNIFLNKNITYNKCREIDESGRKIPNNSPNTQVSFDFSIEIPTQNLKEFLNQNAHTSGVETGVVKREMDNSYRYASDTNLISKFYNEELLNLLANGEINSSFFYTTINNKIVGLYYNSNLPNKGSVKALLTLANKDF